MTLWANSELIFIRKSTLLKSNCKFVTSERIANNRSKQVTLVRHRRVQYESSLQAERKG